MKDLRQIIQDYSRQYHELKNNPVKSKEVEMPGKAYFIDNHNILAMPRDDGDCRYPYGQRGFNFWTYASGYMHCNEGLFSPFLRATEGGEPKIAFFAGLKNDEESSKQNYKVVPLLSVPVMDTNKDLKVERYTIFTMGATYYITEYDQILFAIRTFVDGSNKINFTVIAHKEKDDNREIFISSYINPFLKNAMVENSTDRWFRQVSYHEQDLTSKGLGSFLVETYEELDRSSMTANYGIINRYIQVDEKSSINDVQITTSRYHYVGGVRSSLHTPKALYDGSFSEYRPVCTFTETAIAGDLIHLNFVKDLRYDVTFSYCFTDEEKDILLNQQVNWRDIDKRLTNIEKDEADRQHKLVASFHEEKNNGGIKPSVFNSFFEHLKKQVEFCSLIKGYIQLSSFSLIGIRDVFQAIEALLYWQPEAAREKMLEALNFIAPNGRCPRQYSLPTSDGKPPAMDLRPFIDQGVWVISTIITYLRFTGDFNFLNEVCGYYDIVDDKKHQAKRSEKESTVLQHLFDIMHYLLENRDHDYTRCVCALYGDWNDALDGLGVSKDIGKEYGTGVSVMATLQVYQNLNEMIELLERFDAKAYEDKIETYRQAREEIEKGLTEYAILTKGDKKKLVHGWGDKRDYLVGSFKDPDGVERDGLTSNAFWILSGLYDKDESIESTILDAFNKLDSKYGLKTFQPHFEKNTKGVGRIPNLPAGTAENGAPYIHASMFGIMALFRAGHSELAWEQLSKSLPLTHEKISCSPYVMPNSYGYNEDKFIDGESMQDWQTGSSNVLLKTLIRFVFGFEPHYDGIWIQPSKNIPFKNFEFSIEVKGTKLFIQYENKGNKQREYRIDNVKVQGTYDDIMKLEKLWIDKGMLSKDRILINVID